MRILEYYATTIDPGPWMFYWTLIILGILFLVILPTAVAIQRCNAKRSKTKQQEKEDTKKKSLIDEEAPQAEALPDSLPRASSDPFDFSDTDGTANVSKGVRFDENYVDDQFDLRFDNTMEEAVKDDDLRADFPINLCTIARIDKEFCEIMSLVVPFTISSFTEALTNFSCLCLVGRFVGADQAIAYAEVSILYWLNEELIKGPLRANPTCCCSAIRRNRHDLAGQYVQLSILLYIIIGLPFFLFWCFFTDDMIFWMGWGDQDVADYAQEFARVFIASQIINAVEEGIAHLLDVTDHEAFSACAHVTRGLLNVGTLLFLMLATEVTVTLTMVGLVYICTSAFTLLLVLIVAWCKKWLDPFARGLFRSNGLSNHQAISNLFTIAVPISLGSLLYSAEWVALGIFAAYMGWDEVGAWSIVRFIWKLFDSLTYGMGDAAEIQVAQRLGENQPRLAQLAAYKSLWIGMVEAMVVCGIFVGVMQFIPSLITDRESLQVLVAQTLPYMAVAYMCLTFGYLCWYVTGSCGRYRLGTWIHLFCSWCVMIPIASVFVYGFDYDLRSISAAVVIGYGMLGVLLGYFVFTTDWEARSFRLPHKFAKENDQAEADDDDAAQHVALKFLHHEIADSDTSDDENDSSIGSYKSSAEKKNFSGQEDVTAQPWIEPKAVEGDASRHLPVPIGDYVAMAEPAPGEYVAMPEVTSSSPTATVPSGTSDSTSVAPVPTGDSVAISEPTPGENAAMLEKPSSSPTTVPSSMHDTNSLVHDYTPPSETGTFETVTVGTKAENTVTSDFTSSPFTIPTLAPSATDSLLPQCQALPACCGTLAILEDEKDNSDMVPCDENSVTDGATSALIADDEDEDEPFDVKRSKSMAGDDNGNVYGCGVQGRAASPAILQPSACAMLPSCGEGFTMSTSDDSETNKSRQRGKESLIWKYRSVPVDVKKGTRRRVPSSPDLASPPSNTSEERTIQTAGSRDLINKYKPIKESTKIKAEPYVSLAGQRSRRAKASATRNVFVFMVPSGNLGITMGSPSTTGRGTVVISVDPESVLAGRILPGDRILTLDGFSVRNAPAPLISKILKFSENYVTRTITVLAPQKRWRARRLLKCDNAVSCTPAGQFNDIEEIEIGTSKMKYQTLV